MKFTPVDGYKQIEVIKERNETSFVWDKNQDLVAAEIINHIDLKPKTILVISTMIQEFEFGGEKIKIIPDSAILGYLTF